MWCWLAVPPSTPLSLHLPARCLLGADGVGSACICVLFGVLLLTTQVQLCQCCVCLESIAQSTRSFSTNDVHCHSLHMPLCLHCALSLCFFVALLLTAQVQLGQRCVCLECIAQSTRSFIANPVACFHSHHVPLCLPCSLVVFARGLVCSQPSSSPVSVVFVLSASPSPRAPSTPILLSA